MNIGSIGLGDRPPLKNWEYANAAARTGATGFTADDIGKFARQTDTGAYWELTAVTPTWALLGGGAGAGIQVGISIGAEAANQITITLQLQDSAGNNITTGDYILQMFLSDSDTVPAFAALGSDVAVSTGGFSEIILGMYWLGYFDGGQFVMTMTETGAETWYLCIVMPDGTVTVSDAITFV